MSDPRDEFIAQVVAGQTFVDVGGLWNTVSEKISVAHEHGAIELTMIDIAPPEDQQWIDFANRLQQLGVDPGIVTCLSKDVLSVVEADRKFSATRPCGSKGIGGCDVSMKLCQSSSRCETCPAKGEPARAGSKPGADPRDGVGDA